MAKILKHLASVEPKFINRIIVICLIIDFFAFQKHLSYIVTYLLIIIPLMLFAISNFIWFLRKELPIAHPFLGYTGLLDEKQKSIWALVAFFMTIGMIILVILMFPSIYDSLTRGYQQ